MAPPRWTASARPTSRPRSTLNALRASHGHRPPAPEPATRTTTAPCRTSFGESRIELSGGGTVDLQPGAIAITPGGQVAIAAAGARPAGSRAPAIDVSGSTRCGAAVERQRPAGQHPALPASRFSAANRDGGLKSSDIYVDAQHAGGGRHRPLRAPPPPIRSATSTRLAACSRSAATSAWCRTVSTEWTAIGGQVTLQSTSQRSLVPPVPGQMPPPPVTGEVITQPGSIINLTGGTVTYAGRPDPRRPIVQSQQWSDLQRQQRAGKPRLYRPLHRRPVF